MKKIVSLCFIAFIQLACNNQKPSGGNEAGVEIQGKHHKKTKESDELQLNNGARWNADAITGKNVENLFTVIDEFNSGTDITLSAYKKAAGKFEIVLNQLISQCQMQGPDHDALHKWLKPLMGHLASLKKANDETEAAKVWEAVNLQVDIYPQYFK
jgi:hypothetical protein